MKEAITVTIIQESPVFLNMSASLEKAIALIHEASEKGAELVAFSECWLTGYPVWLDFCPSAALWEHDGAKTLFHTLRENALLLQGPEVQALQKASNECNVIIVIGAHERIGGTLYNSALTFIPEHESPVVRRKLVPTYTERLVWGRGDGSTLKPAETKFGNIGTLICWEHWMPLLRATMHKQEEVLHVAQWPIAKEEHLLASRHYAFEGRTPVIAAGSAMTRSDVIEGYRSTKHTTPAGLSLLEELPDNGDGWIHTGGSTIIAHDGKLLVPQLFKEKGMLTGKIDLTIQDTGFMTLDSSGHYSRPDIFELHVNTDTQPGVVFK